jgi:SAM-dependent methyltransferase
MAKVCTNSKLDEYFDSIDDSNVLVVGSKVYKGTTDRRGFYKNAIGLDMIEGEGVDVVSTVEDFNPGELFSHIDCHSVLEHTPRPWETAKKLEEILQPGGSIYISVPFVWRVHGFPSDYWRFTTEAVKTIFPRICWHDLSLMSYGKTVTDRHPVQKNEGRNHRYLRQAEVIGFGVLDEST